MTSAAPRERSERWSRAHARAAMPLASVASRRVAAPYGVCGRPARKRRNALDLKSKSAHFFPRLALRVQDRDTVTLEPGGLATLRKLQTLRKLRKLRAYAASELPGFWLGACA